MDELLERGRNWLAGTVTVAALGAAVALAVPLVQRPSAPPVQLVSAPAASAAAAAELQVHVVGAVRQPGVYAMPAGSRVGEVIALAEAADDADLAALNLAARLTDGQRLSVPRQGEQTTSTASGGAAGAGSSSRARAAPVAGVPAAGRASAAGGASVAGGAPAAAAPTAATPAKLNLNTATAAELDTLPGIGPVLAGRIIEYRARQGPFTSAQQLRDAKLIPAATYERLRDRVTVE